MMSDSGFRVVSIEQIGPRKFRIITDSASHGRVTQTVTSFDGICDTDDQSDASGKRREFDYAAMRGAVQDLKCPVCEGGDHFGTFLDELAMVECQSCGYEWFEYVYGGKPRIEHFATGAAAWDPFSE